MKIYWYVVLTLIWVFYETISAVNHPCCTLAKYNATQTNQGRAFFRHLISHSDAFNDVNDHTICSLIHFFMQEAAHNNQPIQFSSGLYHAHTSTERKHFDRWL